MNRKNQYKDMEKYHKARNRQRARYYGKTSNAENSRQPYTLKEMELILDHNITDTELAKMLGRSVLSIQIKRSRLKKLKGMEEK